MNELKNPVKYLTAHFNQLRAQVNSEANMQIERTNDISLEEIINRKRESMLEKINQFEHECLTSCDQLPSIEEFFRKQKHEQSTSELIFLNYKRLLFKNRNLIFIRRISIAGPLNDPTAFGKLVNVKKYNH